MLSEVEKKNIQLVKDAMDGILVQHDEKSVEKHFHPTFVQHNPRGQGWGCPREGDVRVHLRTEG